MSLSFVAVLIGGIIGLVLGGRLRHLSTWRLRSWWLVLAGLGLQLAADHWHLAGLGTPAVLVGYGCLLVFAARNALLVGMGVVVVGLMVNLAVVAADGGMPVSPGAVVAAGIAPAGQVGDLAYGRQHHLERPGDHLRLLDDRLPAPLRHQVLSVGDLILAFGVADVTSNLIRRPRRRRLTWSRPSYQLSGVPELETGSS